MTKKRSQSSSTKKPKPIRRKSIKEVREDRLKGFVDRRFVEAVRHRVREHILAVLNEREASTVEIGDEIGLDVTAFYKQVQFLVELGLIEEVQVRSARGASEHVFRATETALFDEKQWKRVPASVKALFNVTAFKSIFADVVASFESGTFNARSDRHFSWVPLVLDSQGWREMVVLLNSTLYRLLWIQRRSAKRLRATGEPGIPTTISLLGFERAPDVDPPAVY
jgi:predicted transcriptional regulator